MKRDLKKAFGGVLKTLREEKGLSQQALADYAELERTYISNLENGLYSPSLNTIYKLAEILKLKPHELIQRVDALMKV